ncbi:unnamed protein product [Caenorhabditis nigoni]
MVMVRKKKKKKTKKKIPDGQAYMFVGRLTVGGRGQQLVGSSRRLFGRVSDIESVRGFRKNRRREKSEKEVVNYLTPP